MRTHTLLAFTLLLTAGCSSICDPIVLPLINDHWMLHGVVKDDTGAPVSRQKIEITWTTSVLSLRTLDSHVTDWRRTLRTDENGAFSFSAWSYECYLGVNRAGYIPLEFGPLRATDCPLQIQFTRIPDGATNIGKRVSWMLEGRLIELPSLKNSRAIGLSLDTYPYQEYTVVKGWVTNKNEADLWFELGGTDDQFAKTFDLHMSTNYHLMKDTDWPLRITGLNGTEIKEAPREPLPGMNRDMDWTLREADAEGYTNELYGFSWNDQYSWSTPDGKGPFSPNFYVRKDNRYGRIVRLQIHPRSREGDYNMKLNRRAIEDIGLAGEFESLQMQTTNLGHRVLQRVW